MYNYSQEQIFIFFFIIGIIIGIIFDVFRSIRKVIKSNNVITFIQDLLFIIISGNLIIYSIIKLNNGFIRFYIFLAITIGISIYFLTISNICAIILTIFIKIFINILKYPIKSYKVLAKKYLKRKKKDF